LSKRIIYSVILTFFRSFITFVTSILLIRFIGVENYGNYIFLLSSFIALWGLTDLGSSSVFFTLVSQAKPSISFLRLFWIWIFLQFVLLYALVKFLLPDKYINAAWGNIDHDLMMLALICSFFQGTIWNHACRIAESARKTILYQVLFSIIVTLHIVVILFLYTYNILSLKFLFLSIIIEFFIGSALIIYAHKKYLNNTNSDSINTYNSLITLIHKTLPTIPYVIFGFIKEFGDRWALQNYSGSYEQGVFSISEKFSAVILLITSSVLKVYWKEVALHNFKSDFSKISSLYTIFTNLICFLGIIFASFLTPLIPSISKLVNIDSESSSILCFGIMLFVPIFTSINQLQVTFMYATLNTKAHSIIAITVYVFGYFLTVILLCPSIIGLQYNLGSFGLSFKLLLTGIVSTYLYTVYLKNSFCIKVYYSKYIVCMLTCLLVSFFVFIIIDQFYLGILSRIILHLVLFFILLIFLQKKYSNLFCFTINDLIFIKKQFLSKV
jgi:O-antigen/teichoic acid export membrane protein